MKEINIMRLLFAEDEKSLSRAITAILKKNHYEVDAVYDGEEALAYYHYQCRYGSSGNGYRSQ